MGLKPHKWKTVWSSKAGVTSSHLIPLQKSLENWRGIGCAWPEEVLPVLRVGEFPLDILSYPLTQNNLEVVEKCFRDQSFLKEMANIFMKFAERAVLVPRFYYLIKNKRNNFFFRGKLYQDTVFLSSSLKIEPRDIASFKQNLVLTLM